MPPVQGTLKVVKSIKVDGDVYASPIAVNGVIVVATENHSVYGFGRQGRQLWHVRVGKPSPAFERDCGNIDPLGITGSPIYSAQTGDVYVVALSSETAPSRRRPMAGPLRAAVTHTSRSRSRMIPNWRR
jgi:outer membrane protein assembly factor BamB